DGIRDFHVTGVQTCALPIYLLTDIRACDLCQAALPHGVNPVLQIDPAARILIAAQAPGRKVHETNVPFNDASGERLRTWMGVSQIGRASCRERVWVAVGAEC